MTVFNNLDIVIPSAVEQYNVWIMNGKFSISIQYLWRFRQQRGYGKLETMAVSGRIYNKYDVSEQKIFRKTSDH